MFFILGIIAGIGLTIALILIEIYFILRNKSPFQYAKDKLQKKGTIISQDLRRETLKKMLNE